MVPPTAYIRPRKDAAPSRTCIAGIAARVTQVLLAGSNSPVALVLLPPPIEPPKMYILPPTTPADVSAVPTSSAARVAQLLLDGSYSSLKETALPPTAPPIA